VRRDLHASLRIVVLATLAVLAVAALAPGRVELGLRVYALLLCALALALALAALRRAYPRTRTLRPHARPAAERRPASLDRLEHLVSLGSAGAFDLHHRLLPRLRALAAGLLLARRRVALADAGAARDVLGDETWQLVRPDRPPPEDRLARGLPLADLERAVASLERV
jgi:hypothetical protein